MSAHTKGRHTKVSYTRVTIRNGNKTVNYKIPNNEHVKDNLTNLLKPWKESKEAPITSWEQLASERIEKYKKAGLVLRGARYREGISQKELAKRCDVSQDNLSKIENGKRVVGEKVARRLAEALHFDYRLLLT